MMKNSHPGLTALITVMVLGSVALLTALVIALRGTSEVDLGFSTLQGKQADVVLAGCVDDAVLRLSRDQHFAQQATVTVPIENSTCDVRIYEVPGTSFLTYTVAARAGRGRAQKCAYVQVIIPSMQFSTFQEISCSLLTF